MFVHVHVDKPVYVFLFHHTSALCTCLGGKVRVGAWDHALYIALLWVNHARFLV